MPFLTPRGNSFDENEETGNVMASALDVRTSASGEQHGGGYRGSVLPGVSERAVDTGGTPDREGADLALGDRDPALGYVLTGERCPSLLVLL